MERLDHEGLVANNGQQELEAKSPDNRYFFALNNPDFGREPTIGELMLYYIDNGGATGHRQRKEARAAEQEEPEHSGS
jgi:hypothetical protein